MVIIPLSDLHFEFHADGGREFVESLDPSGVDVLVLAGDICAGDKISKTMAMFCERFPTVVYVIGNHEHYGVPRKVIAKELDKASIKNDNFYPLATPSELDQVVLTSRRSAKTVIQGSKLTFLGGAMWFRDSGGHECLISDFDCIADFEEWVYRANREFRDVCWGQHESGEIEWGKTVVVTHHLPSQHSVHYAYRGNPLNCFFVCDMDEFIEQAQPALWIHGHTHKSCDYQHPNSERTRVVCNPFGYPDAPNRNFDERKLISI